MDQGQKLPSPHEHSHASNGIAPTPTSLSVLLSEKQVEEGSADGLESLQPGSFSYLK